MSRVLIVDGEPVVLAALAALVRHHGYLPVPAGDRTEAVAAYRHAPDIAVGLVDAGLPGPHGTATLGALRAAGAAFPCLFLSADPGAAGRADLLTCGAHAVLLKPVSVAELGAALAAAVAPPGA